ncbi:NAD(P)-binding protein, partial [Marasmius fiardii PR-910]
FNPPQSSSVQDSKPVKFGILGAANIAPPALIIPARSHPEVEVYAVAARDINRANAFAKKHGIPKAYQGYQNLLDDPQVQVVYNPLPNGLHYEWTMKALAAGKHVLLEKPASNTADETRRMFELAESKGLILLEAFHYRFHPAVQRTKAILDSGELGAIKNIQVYNMAPMPWADDDIRYNYDLGGGGLMDMGCYTISCIRYLAGANPTQVLTSTYELHKPKTAPPNYDSKVDRMTLATFAFPNDVTGSIGADLSMPFKWKIIPPMPRTSAIVECEQGSIELFNYILPTLYHSITITKREGKKKKTRTEKAYKPSDVGMEGKGEDWWLTYRYQLEAFMDRLKGRSPQAWVDKEDSVANMEWIEKVYEKNGLGVRPRSTYTP